MKSTEKAVIKNHVVLNGGLYRLAEVQDGFVYLSPLWGKCRVAGKRGAKQETILPHLTVVLPPQGREMKYTRMTTFI